VRAGYSIDHLMHSQFAIEIGAAHEIAETWKNAILAKGSFQVMTEAEER